MIKESLNHSNQSALGKSEERRRLRALRRTHEPSASEAAELVARVMRVVERTGVASVGLFQPISGEPDIVDELFERLLSRGVRVGLPSVDYATDVMTYVEWTPSSRFEKDRYGIPTPVGAEAFEPELMVVPCLGFAEEGFRLGYGKGYFDRYLTGRRSPVVTLGVAYEAFKVDASIFEMHDVPLMIVVTESATYA